METETKKALVCGAGGFIGSHMVKKLKYEGYWVRGADVKEPDFSGTEADEFLTGDLTDQAFCDDVTNIEFDEIYQFAADMGGAGYIFTGEHDADVMNNSATINLNILRNIKDYKPKIFFSSSACMYPEHNQLDPNTPDCREDTAYPANPDSDMVGKNFSLKGYTFLIIVTTMFLFVLPDIIISSGPKERGQEEEKKLLQQSVAKLLNSHRKVEPSRCGEMAYKLVPSCSLMNASKQPTD